MIDWVHIATTVLTVTVPILWSQWRISHKVKAELIEKERLKDELLEELRYERLFLSPHMHSEKDGPLCAEGIIRRSDELALSRLKRRP